MKTIGDLERWLRADDSRTAFINVERGKMTVDLVSDKGNFQVEMQSSTLEGAFENAMDELRRRANNMQPVRETKPEPKPSITVTLPAGTVTVNPAPALSRLPSISQAGQQAYQAQQQAQYPTCIRCGNLPRQIDWNPHFALHCNCGHVWSPPKFVGMQIKGSWGSVYSWDGSHWMPVAP